MAQKGTPVSPLAAELTELPEDKVLAVSTLAKLIKNQWEKNKVPTICKQALAEGIRKVHDAAKSKRGAGKFLGHAHWSRSAVRLLGDSRNHLKLAQRKLTHEHVVPVNVVVDVLLAIDATAPLSSFSSSLCNTSIVAIITRDEDARLRSFRLGTKMPADWDGQDLWARYRYAGLLQEIEVPA